MSKLSIALPIIQTIYKPPPLYRVRFSLLASSQLLLSVPMAKGDDARLKKKNKANRKKLRNESSTVSARVAGIIAAKKRRMSGKRRTCEGMCYSLPTPEDPFNDRHEKKDFKKKETKKLVSSQADGMVSVNGKSAPPRKGNVDRNHRKVDHQEQKKQKIMNLENEQKKTLMSIGNVGQKNSIKPEKEKIQLHCKGGVVCDHEGQSYENLERPSKFLIMCLNSIQNALRHDGTFSSEEDKPLFVNEWGVEFWKSYSVGKDILETSGACSTVEQIAWMVSSAADTIARKEKEGLSFASPFLLFLVPSQEKAAKVRSVCKPLKPLGIHTVSLHPGAPLDHQIHGLKSCEPEFLVSTPGRLLELVSLKAIDISGVSLLVVDGLEGVSKVGHLDMIKSIKQSISGNPITVVFNDCLSHASVPALQNLLMGSICRLSLNYSITSRSACIVQSVLVCASEEEKISKGIEVLDHACVNQFCPQLIKVLFIVWNDSKFHKLVTALKSKGYSVSTDTICNNTDTENRKMRPAVSMIDMEHISTVDLGEYEVVIILDFALSIDNYIEILTSMARHTVNGFLQSFFTRENALLAGPLIQILEQCGQTVPEALRNLCPTLSISEQ